MASKSMNNKSADSKDASAVIKFLPNSDVSWHTLVNTIHNSNGGHNAKCSVDSISCSKEMALDVPSDQKQLCAWHRSRMAVHETVRCGCRDNAVCNGDATGRIMFRNYYNLWDIAVCDVSGQFYCCGTCQNADTQTHRCGDMNVCPTHLQLHDAKTLRPINRKYSDDEGEDEEEEDGLEEDGEPDSDSSTKVKEPDGPVKVLTPGVFGIRQGDGYVVSVAHSRGNVTIKSYVDAVKLHLWAHADGEEDAALKWQILASHMPDRPSYVTPIKFD